MLMLCEKCIQSLLRKGEKIKRCGYEYGKFEHCDICDTPDFLSGVICKNDELIFNDQEGAYWNYKKTWA